jgi:hypothetical protein
MSPAGIDAVHYVHLVHRGRGQLSRAKRVMQWYQDAFGAQVLHHTFHESSILHNTPLHHVYYLRLGRISSCIILEVRDSSS